MTELRDKLTTANLWVVKVGSAILTSGGEGVSESFIDSLANQILQLRQLGYKVVLVSSGAIAQGMARLNWNERPKELNMQQAAAAVGQTDLIHSYQACFEKYNITTAQVLLTHDDIANRQRYLNAKSALHVLLDLGVVPIINENDMVAVDEIRFGDNDSLAALVVNLLQADNLIILTDQSGMYNKNPAEFKDAILLDEVMVEDKKLDNMASSKGGNLGKGGMLSKLIAARIAAKSGANTIIAPGKMNQILLKISQGEKVGTLLTPAAKPLNLKSQWLISQLQVKGKVVLDQGAVNALVNNGKSLLSIGIIESSGDFKRGELVTCVDSNEKELARGLINYNSKDTKRICGKSSSDIELILGYIDEDELIHRDNLVLI